MKFGAAFKPFRILGHRLVGNKVRVLYIIGVATRKASRDPAALKQAWADLQALMQLLRAWVIGEYRAIPLRSVGLIIGALLYFISPIDAIPDFLPGGLIDDVAILGAVMLSMKGDLLAFRLWQQSRGVAAVAEKPRESRSTRKDGE